MNKKIARLLLRVSSNQQLEADGDLSVQRQLVTEYVEKQGEWVLDKKEYFEGSNSGYKNRVCDRATLQEALSDAQRGEYQILVAYKDDRVGRRMWEMGAYIMTLKSLGVDVYTVKDGCISPGVDDVMGQMMLALRYGSAQKSSSDTGMRVKDTAQKLVQKGRFMGGKAPYGYELVLSGELSKHGRALHTLKIVPEQAEAVKYIYHLSFYKEYGSCKIAKLLNEDEIYRKLAPKDVWKSGTVTSILTNPVYAGYTAYKRRERRNGRVHRLDSDKWILAANANDYIKIIDEDLWNQTQEKRRLRAKKYMAKKDNQVTIMSQNAGSLPLIDVLYCGYCGQKLTNDSKYSYWTIKGSGERKRKKTVLYRCQQAQQGVPHDKTSQYLAEAVEAIVFDCVFAAISGWLKEEDIFNEVEKEQNKIKANMEREMKKGIQALSKIERGIEVMETHLPDAMTGGYVLSMEELVSAIRKQKEKETEQKMRIDKIKIELKCCEDNKIGNGLKKSLPTWIQILSELDNNTKRVLVNKLIEKILITKEELIIRFRVDRGTLLRGIICDIGTIPCTHDLK